MTTRFAIGCRKIEGNLFISPMGDLNGSSACELVNMINDQYDGTGQVIIETNGICRICPFGRRVFKCQLCLACFPVRRICFVGLHGRALAPKGSRVRPAIARSTGKSKNDGTAK